MDGLYHGTRSPFGPGGLVLPGELFGTDHHGLGRSDRVYVTTDLELAKDYAVAAEGRGRAKVFSVLYEGEIEVDDSTVGGEEQESFRVSSARIVRRVWVEEAVDTPTHSA